MGQSVSSEDNPKAKWWIDYLENNKPPEPSASLEGDSRIRKGGTFCILVRGHEEEKMKDLRPVLVEGMSVVDTKTEIRGGDVDGWPTIYRRFFIRATVSGSFGIYVREEKGFRCIEGSPIRITVLGPPKPSSSLEGEAEIRAGFTFCILVKCHEEKVVEGIKPRLKEGMTILRIEKQSQEAPPDGWPTFFRRFHIRATRSGSFSIVVDDRNNRNSTNGSPIRVHVLPAPISIESSHYAPCNGETPAVGHICHVASAVEYDFFPHDEFGNSIPCDYKIASQFSVQCSTDLMIMDAEPRGNTVRLFFRPLEEGQVDVMLMFDKTPVFPAPVTILTVPQDLAVALRENSIDVSQIKCSLVSYCTDEVGAVEENGNSNTVYIYVTPSKVTVKRFVLGIFGSVIMCWPLNRALSITVVDIPEDRRYSVSNQRAFLDISEVGTGRMRLLMPKMSALNIAASTKQALNNRYVGGALDKRKHILNERLKHAKSGFDTLDFNISRKDIISEAWKRFSKMKDHGNFLADTHVFFIGEDGKDCGGLSKEFMATLQRDLFSPESGLWAPASSAIKLQPHSSEPPPAATAAAEVVGEEKDVERDQELFAPLVPRADPSTTLSERTGISLDNLYKLCGIVVARTLAGCVSDEGQPQLPYRIASSVFKHILSLEVNHHDLEHDDPSFYKSTIRQILDNDVEYLELAFTEDLFSLDGKYVRSVNIDPQSHEYYALRKSGSKKHRAISSVNPEEALAVTEENKLLYVDEIARYRLRGAMIQYLDAFREGFVRVMQDEDTSLLTPNELVMVTCASVSIDPEDMRKNTDVVNEDKRRIEWLWEAIQTFCETERRMFLLFVTGNMCPPQGGFARMKPKLKVVCLKLGSHNDLPRAHTCFNQLDLPPYNSYSELFSKLLIAINEGCDYNGMA